MSLSFKFGYDTYMNPSMYTEDFKNGPGGWYGWINNAQGPKPLELQDGHITSRSPWWIDYNHAPPGAGYIHMVFCLSTTGPQGECYQEAGGLNRFIEGSHPINFTDAKITMRSRGELLSRSAEMVLLIQSNVDGIISGWLRTGEPFKVTEEWSTQTITLDPDESGWTALGVRHDRADMYGVKPLDKVLSNIDVNIMLVMFPLVIEPMGPLDADPHILRPERDYPVWRSKLPEGYVTMDKIEIQFA